MRPPHGPTWVSRRRGREPEPLTGESEYPRLLEAIRGLALAAGRIVMAHYEGGFDVRSKADSSPVTLADEEAERLILAGLHRLTPDVPVVAEEEAAAGRLPAAVGRRFWLVDPLDGTKEFVAKNGEFTVNIALVEDGVPALGVVLAPARGLAYTAHGPGTARRETAGAPPEPIAVRAAHADGIVVVSSRSHGDRARMEQMVGVPVRDWKILGSSLKFCVVAEGGADLYPRYGHTREWDTAAGHAVLLAAGGSVTALDGGPFIYGKPHFLNEGFIARGRMAPAIPG